MRILGKYDKLYICKTKIIIDIIILELETREPFALVFATTVLGLCYILRWYECVLEHEQKRKEKNQKLVTTSAVRRSSRYVDDSTIVREGKFGTS